MKKIRFICTKSILNYMKNSIKTIALSLVITGVSTIAAAQQGKVTVDQPRDIDRLLEFKKDVRTVNLFKIQVYSGDRSGAEAARSDFQSAFAEWPVQMVYEEPNTKIQVGEFSNRLEADKALLKIKSRYTNAFIFEPKED